MDRKISLETDLEAQKPYQEVFLGFGLGKASIFFVFSYAVLSNILKKGVGGMETLFLGIILIGTVFIFLKKYDSEEIEAYILYLARSAYFSLFEKGVKKLDIVKNIKEDYFVLQDGGLRAVIEVFCGKELSEETPENTEKLIHGYSQLLETFSQYFQIVARIRKISPQYLVLKNFGTTETPTAREYLKQFSKHSVPSLKIYIVLAVDPPKWFYMEKRDEKSLKNSLEEKVSSCKDFLSKSESVSGFKRLSEAELLDFVFDDNFYQNRNPKEKEITHQNRILSKISRKITPLKQRFLEKKQISKLMETEKWQKLSKKAKKAISTAREFFQVPESEINPALRNITDYHVAKENVYCNGIYIKSLLVKFLPERKPSLIVKEMLELSQDIDISMHQYPDQGGKIRKILGTYHKTLTEQLEEERKKGNATLTSIYQEKQLKEAYNASLAGKNLFLATIILSVYDYNPKRLKATTKKVKKALRPAGITTDPLKFRQEQAFLTSIPFGTDRIKKYTAIEAEKLAEGTMPFIEHSIEFKKRGIPIGVEIKKGGA